MNTKELFCKLLYEKGYTSINDFANRNGIDPSNMHKRVKGITQRVEIGWMFKIANILHVPVEEIVHIFYIDEWNENRSLIEK